MIYSLATKTNITWRNRLFLIGYVTAYKVADTLIQPTNFCFSKFPTANRHSLTATEINMMYFNADAFLYFVLFFTVIPTTRFKVHNIQGKLLACMEEHIKISRLIYNTERIRSNEPSNQSCYC